MIGASDQSCWLAEACKIRLLLLLLLHICELDITLRLQAAVLFSCVIMMPPISKQAGGGV